MSTPRAAPTVKTGCARWPDRLRLRSSAGDFVRGRCRASNLCDYCGRLAAIENAEMVALDACVDAPGLHVVQTTRDPSISPADVRRHQEHTTRTVRRRWPNFEAATFTEHTTGRSKWSGGHRRIHFHRLVKGVPAADAEELRAVLLATWGARTDTRRLSVDPIYAAEGLIRYVTNLALHVAKEGQKPPAGWSGKRVRWTQGYFGQQSAQDTRALARTSLQRKREAYRLQLAGVEAGQALQLADLELAARAGVTWELVEVHRLADSSVIEPGRVIA